ncbi:MAG: AbrB family transcriptional regulator [Pseudomonadota bacterium]
MIAPNLPDAKGWAVWAIVVLIGVVGGALASLVGAPLPWLLGAMVATALALAIDPKVAGRSLAFPQSPRMAFVTVIGVAIGGTAKPEMWSEIGGWWPSLLTVLVFVGVAQLVNYQIFRRIAGYDPPTAYYCATPGGLIESVQLGEEAGGNAALLTVQHFSRITITVSIVPLIYWAMRGEAVGSAAGVSMENGTTIGILDVAILAGCAVFGGWGGRRVGLPAAIITGPILLSALAHATGITSAQLPDWLISVAQLVVGIGLAMRFRGMTRPLLIQGISLGLLTVSVMLGIGAGLALLLDISGDHAFQVLLMCYAPGGVVEMGLIALSLGVSPMMVTLHHIIRIGFTVTAVPLIARWVLR